MKKSRWPKKKEDQKSKAKKGKKKAAGQVKKAQDECSGINSSLPDSVDDGKAHIMINVPPPPRFSEVGCNMINDFGVFFFTV